MSESGLKSESFLKNINRNEIFGAGSADEIELHELLNAESIQASNPQPHKVIDIDQKLQQNFTATIKNPNEKSEEILIQGCRTTEDILNYLISTFPSNELIRSKKVLVLRFQIGAGSVDFNATDLQELNKVLSSKNVVVVMDGNLADKSSIYWKLKEFKNYVTLKPFSNDSTEKCKKILQYIEDFLVDSLSTGHSGILSTYVIQGESDQIDINLLADIRKYNLLLIAAEQGNAEIVQILLNFGMITDFLYTDAQTLAWENRHSNVLLELLKTNLTYPNLFDIKKCSKELTEFYEATMDLHEAIKSKNEVKVKAILKRGPNSKHFYNSSNESALKIAIDSQAPKIYDILLEHQVRFAPHEDAEDLYKGLEYEMKRTLREIHNKHSQVSDEKHLNILFANSFISHDNENAQKNVEHIQRAFQILNANVFIKIILMIVAASRKFKIIFDFNRDSVNVADPTVEANTQGLFYLSGRIYIGAKQLLNEATSHETFGVIAHELCHYAMNVVFGNEARPYTSNDNQTMQEFEKISEDCQKNHEKEKIVDLVYDCYPEEIYHAELIVRVVHMLGFYYNQPAKLLELRGYFTGLFNFYENRIVAEMKAALPRIEKKVEEEIKKKDKKISKLTKLLYLSIGLGIVFACLASFYFYNPTYKFDELSDKNQGRVKNSLVVYKNVEVKLNELFPGNSEIFKNLTSDHISQLLGGKKPNFGDSHLRYLEEQIILKWENLPKKLKEKFLNSNLNFQGEIVEFKIFSKSCSDAFASLTSQQIINVLNGIEFVVGEKVDSEVGFYIERKFIPEDAKLINFEYEYGHEYVDSYETREEHVENRTKIESFHEFTEKFLKQDLNDIFNIFGEVKSNLFFKSQFYNLNYEDYHFMYRSFNQIIEKAQDVKVLILSSEAGAGKTVTFEQLAIEMKKKFPTRWVSYINLKDHTKLYKTRGTAGNIKNLLKKILKLSSEKNEFEVRIFEESFKSGTAVLVWNGFDEISPNYSEFILNVLKSVYNNTINVQLVCTRPLYSEQLSKAFRIRPWQLVPFDEDEKHKFLREYFISQNVSSKKIDENIANVEKITQKLTFNDNDVYNFKTPLMLKLVAEIHENEDLFESADIYGIYEAFVQKKIEIWIEKSKNSRFATKLISSGSLKTIFQKFALLNEINTFLSTTLGLKLRKLQIMQKEIPKYLPIEEISRMGILFINGKSNFEFSHRTFAEFFVAQYFIENVYDVDGDVNSDEAELRLELFYVLAQNYGFYQQIVTDFMSSFLQMRNENETKIFHPTISGLLRTKFKKFFIRMLDMRYPRVFKFLFDFFKKDHDLLVDLLHANENETFYTAILNPSNFALSTDTEYIKDLAQNCLDEEEFQKFIKGKNQKGKVLFGLHFYDFLGFTKSDALYEIETKALSGTSFWEFFDKVKGNLTKNEEKELFVTALSPKIYLPYDKIFSIADFPEYEKIWTNFEGLLSTNEMQDVLGNAFILYIEISPGDKTGNENFLSLLLRKAEKFLSSSQIFEMFLTKNILHEAHDYENTFETIWEFLSKHTNEDERRTILLQDDIDDKNFHFYTAYDEDRKNVSSYEHSYYYYDFTPFKIFHRALFFYDTPTFDFTVEIYKKHFNKSEVQDIILSSNDFFYYAISYINEESCKNFVSYLEELFEGHEKMLQEYFDQKIKHTSLSVLKFIEDFRGLPQYESNLFNNLDTFLDLYDRIKDDSNKSLQS